MKKMPVGPAETLEARLPEFVDMVQSSADRNIRVRMDDFEDDPTLLYNCVWYALSYKKCVLIESE